MNLTFFFFLAERGLYIEYIIKQDYFTKRGTKPPTQTKHPQAVLRYLHSSYHETTG